MFFFPCSHEEFAACAPFVMEYAEEDGMKTSYRRVELPYSIWEIMF